MAKRKPKAEYIYHNDAAMSGAVISDILERLDKASQVAVGQRHDSGSSTVRMELIPGRQFFALQD